MTRPRWTARPWSWSSDEAHSKLVALQIIEDWRDLSDDVRGAAIAFGEFDGVHLGHRAVIALAAKAARDLDAPLG
ncbi:MAG TPA: hypothetical protein VII42_04690, partial [Caulobacteraceae bacterium]